MTAFPTQRGPQPFLDAYEARVRPLHQEHGETYWRFALTGDAALQGKLEVLENTLSDLHADAAAYDAIRSWLAAGTDDPLVQRQLEVVLPDFRRAQVDAALRTEIIKLNLEVEEVCTTFRPVLDGRPWSSNELDRGLMTERSDARRRAIWEATREVGAQIRDRVVRLAKLRNRQAQAVGYDDYFDLALADQEMDRASLFTILDDLRARTDGPWAALKSGLDAELAPLRDKAPADLAPWDYPDRFLQSVPRQAPGRSTDAFFSLRSIKKNTLSFYRGIGLPVDELWRRGDLLPRDGKSPHAFCIGIDNPTDVRVLCNLDGTARWQETALHEFGHAVYNRGISSELPWLLRDAAHTFITEAVAMYFGRMVKSRPWLESVAGVPDELARASARDQREAQLVFARWGLLVTTFERAMYADPDQDLDAVWWSLVEDIQGLRRPDGWRGGDWASKVHVACYPAYYQNYLLGELLASQLQACLHQRIGAGPDEGVARRSEVGAFFSELFVLGQRLPWERTVQMHTGAPLNATHWVEQFAGEV